MLQLPGNLRRKHPSLAAGAALLFRSPPCRSPAASFLLAVLIGIALRALPDLAQPDSCAPSPAATSKWRAACRSSSSSTSSISCRRSSSRARLAVVQRLHRRRRRPRPAWRRDPGGGIPVGHRGPAQGPARGGDLARHDAGAGDGLHHPAAGARIVLPPVGNYAIGLLKDTSLCSLIGVNELMNGAKSIAFAEYQPMAVFVLVAGIYFVMSYPLSHRRPLHGAAAQYFALEGRMSS